MIIIVTESANATATIARALSVSSTAVADVYAGKKYAVLTIAKGFITPYGVSATTGPDSLPCVPERYAYGIRLSDVDGKREIAPEDQAFADYLAEFFAGAEEVVFASDGGADAQGRFQTICRFFKVGCKTCRMWLTRLEPKSVRHAFKHREYGRQLHRLGQTGTTGAAMNSLFAHNFTEAYRPLFREMQTDMRPMDLIVLSAIQAINAQDAAKAANFKSVTTHSVTVSGEVLGENVKFFPMEVWDTKEEAIAAYNALKIPATIAASHIDVDKEVMDSPKLFTLASLQTEAWKELGFSFSKTSDIADRLYDKGFISSPRTRTHCLPASLKPLMFNRFHSVKGMYFVPDCEITGAHGIITTGRNPNGSGFSKDELALYSLIDDRIAATLAGPKKTAELIIGIEIDGQSFFGTMPWTVGAKAPKEATVKLNGKSQFTNTTKPPMRTEMPQVIEAVAALITRVEREYTGTMPFNDDIHDISGSIDRLRDNRFIIDCGGEPIVSGEGKMLIETFGREIGVGQLLSFIIEADMLYGNPRKGVGGKSVIADFGEWVYDKVEALITDPRLFPATSETKVCPFCKRHSVLSYPKSLTCPVCGFSMPRQFKGHVFTDKEIDHLLTHGYTSTDLKFTNRRGHEFFDAVALGNRRGVEFVPIAAQIY